MSHTDQANSPLSLDEIEALQIDNDFWQCSLDLWKNSSLQDALLSLQDQQGFRVNLILFALWLGLENKAVKTHLAEINEATQAWHDQIVAPLRTVRKLLPKHNLRKSIQLSELQAEQIEQALLYDFSKRIQVNSSNQVIDTLIENLFASRLPESHLLLCIQACLPDYSETEIQSEIRKHSISS